MCELDETDKGIFIKYVVRESEDAVRKATRLKRSREEGNAEQKQEQVTLNFIVMVCFIHDIAGFTRSVETGRSTTFTGAQDRD